MAARDPGPPPAPYPKGRGLTPRQVFASATARFHFQAGNIVTSVVGDPYPSDVECTIPKAVVVHASRGHREPPAKPPFDGDRIVTDLAITRRLQLAQLQSIQRRLGGNRRAILAPRRELARQNRHHRIVAQLVVVVEILVAPRDPEYPLPRQRHHLVLDQPRTPYIVKAPRKLLRKSAQLVDRASRSRDQFIR